MYVLERAKKFYNETEDLRRFFPEHDALMEENKLIRAHQWAMRKPTSHGAIQGSIGDYPGKTIARVPKRVWLWATKYEPELANDPDKLQRWVDSHPEYHTYEGR